MTKHVITALVENRPGVMARIVGLISGRGFNIDTVIAAPTKDPTVSRVTLQVPGDDRVLDQVTKQLNKLVDVIEVSDLSTSSFIDRELVLVKVSARDAATLAEVEKMVQSLGATIASRTSDSVLVQVAGDRANVEKSIASLEELGVLAISRSGIVTITE
jgi:acetolactate synthase-1/3 small subunit